MFETIGGILGIFALSIIIAGFFMWIGAKLAGVAKSSFGLAIGAAIVVSLVTWVISGLFSILPVIGTLLGFVIALIVSIFLIKAVFDTSLGKAFLTWIFNIMAQFLAIFIGSLIFVGSIQDFLEKYLN